MSRDVATRATSSQWSAQLARQSTRRTLVAVWAFCCLAFLALGIADIKGVIWFVLIAITVAADVILFIATHRVTDLPTSALDEREQALRNRAYRSAYLAIFYAIAVVVGGALLLLLTGHEIGPQWLAHPAANVVPLTGFSLATLQVVSLLPTAIVAWTERDEPRDIE